MRILISTPVWGEKNRALFADYGLASLLAAGNLPALALDHIVTMQLVTSAVDRDWLMDHPNMKAARQFVHVVTAAFEHHAIGDPPGPDDPAKYRFVSGLQNIAFASSFIYDVVVPNYADFVWADGSLPNAIDLLGTNDAVLGVALPVIDFACLHRGRAAPRALAALAIENLHIGAIRRLWPGMAVPPSYCLFHVPDQGLVVRAYHQTALAIRVKDTAEFRAGIDAGTLDGAFTAVLARRGPVVHADDSDRVLVVSLHDGKPGATIDFETRRKALDAFKARCAPEQLAFATVPLRVRRALTDPAAWAEVERSSAEVVCQPVPA